MIGRLRGVLAERGSDGSCVLDVGGVGYELFVPIGSLGRLPLAPETVTLHVHTHVREDALVLFGFARQSDRHAFRVVLSVSGVGPKLALAVLSALPAEELAQVIARQDRTVFKGIPGVGKKTAERLLLELKDKLPTTTGATGTPSAPAAAVATGPLADVVSALVQMGFKPMQAEKSVSGPDASNKSVEELLRNALSQMN